MSEEIIQESKLQPGMTHFEYAALAIMCACIQADKDLPMDNAARFGIEGAIDLTNELDKHYANQKGVTNES